MLSFWSKYSICVIRSIRGFRSPRNPFLGHHYVLVLACCLLFGSSSWSQSPESAAAAESEPAAVERDPQAVSNAKKRPARAANRGTAKPTAVRRAEVKRPAVKPKSNTVARSASASAVATKALIAKVVVEGNRKIEYDAVVARIRSQAGQPLDPDVIREDLRTLYRSGFFQDIQFLRDGTIDQPILVIQVTEKPSVVDVTFEGNSEIKIDEIKEAVNVKTFEILNMSKIRDASEKIQKLYEDKGFFLARVESSVEDVKAGETVKINFKILENEKVKVKKITLLGNKELKDGYIKGRLQTAEGGFFSFLSGSGSYKQEAFERDMQILRLLYFNEGYVQVKIDRPQIYVTPDKKGIYITIRIDEGLQYNVGEIDFAGDLLFPKQDLVEVIQINKREIFSWETLQKDLSELQAKYGDLGYAFANVIPRTTFNEQERKMNITFEFDKGSKVYFGQINVVGNSKTRDKVVRRELKVVEGELYNETRKRESLENVQRLGFFDDVSFKTSTPPEKPDQLNVDIVVKERNTGSIQLGAGYGTATKMTVQGQINQSNFLGKGQKLSASVNLSEQAQLYNLNFTEPYFMDTKWALGFDAYQSRSNRYEYVENRRGGAFRFGHPLGDYWSGSIRYRLDRTDADPALDANNNVITDPDIYDLKTVNGITSSVTGVLEYDRRNDRFSPSKGLYFSQSIEYAGLGGFDLRYTKALTNFKYFYKLFWDVVWRNNISYGIILPNAQAGEPPFTELFALGGPYSLRGYDMFRVGKTRYSTKRFLDLKNAGRTDEEANRLSYVTLGGRQQLLLQTELEFPLIAEAGIKGVVFFDVGEAEDEIRADRFYSNVGFGFRWFSPIGPLRFEWGFPLRELDQSPRPMVFEFSIGSPF